MNWRVCLGIALLSGGPLSCATAPDAFSRCSRPFDLAVADGATPTFAWAPADCAVYTVTVLQTQTVKWHLFVAATANALAPTITYGSVPAGARASVADPLVPGITYTVQLTRVDADGHERIVGSQAFVR